MSELLIFLSELLIRLFLDKKRAIRSEIKWANSQPCENVVDVLKFKKYCKYLHAMKSSIIRYLSNNP